VIDLKKLITNTKGVSTTVTVILMIVTVIISVTATAFVITVLTPKASNPPDNKPVIKTTAKTALLFGKIAQWDYDSYYTCRVFYGGLRSHESGNSSKKIMTLIFDDMGLYKAGAAQVTLDYQEGMTIDLPYAALKNVVATEMSISFDEVLR
jgi:hypothetical protein